MPAVSGDTEENHEKLRIGHLISGPRFETRTYRLRSRSANHSPAIFDGKLTRAHGLMNDGNADIKKNWKSHYYSILSEMSASMVHVILEKLIVA
jgi:hypothetical protein